MPRPRSGIWCARWLVITVPGRTLGLGRLAVLGGRLLKLTPFFWMWFLVGDAVFHVHGAMRAPTLLADLEMAAGSPFAEAFAHGTRLHRRHRLHPARAAASLERAGPLSPSVRAGYELARREARLP